MKKKKPTLYYVFGGVLATLGVIDVVFFATLPMAIKDPFSTSLGWISLVCVAVGVIVFFIGYFLLKKANFIKLNNDLYYKDKKEDKDENE